MTQVTVITEDKLVIVNGEALDVEYDYPDNLWAIQWNGTTGEAEWTNKSNTIIEEALILPYIDAWQLAKDNQPIPVEPTAQEMLNAESLAYLEATDWKMQRHSDELLSGVTPSLSPTELTELLSSRQEAREAIV